MKLFVLLALLPCMLAAEIQNSICADGTQCPQGKYCCRLPNGEPGCCDLPKDLHDKSYVAGLPVSSSPNVSMAEAEAMHAYCPGTQCGVFCIPDIKYGVCCSQPAQACPSGTKCCSSSLYLKPWCCKRRQFCSSIFNVCINSAVTTSIAMITVMFTFFIGMISKYIL